MTISPPDGVPEVLAGHAHGGAHHAEGGGEAVVPGQYSTVQCGIEWYRGTSLQLEGPGINVDLVKLEEGLEVVDEVRHVAWPRPTAHRLLTVNTQHCTLQKICKQL